MAAIPRDQMKAKRIGVLMGGLSAEREVSLKTGQAALQALKRLGYDAVEVDSGHDLAAELVKLDIDIAFIALHGRFGEDGRVQGQLEMISIPYTGSGVMSSAIAIDKIMTKKLLLYHELPTPGFDFLNPGDSVEALLDRCRHFPLVAKPAREGSTLGITVAKDRLELKQGIEAALQLDGRILVEDFIDGQELTVSVLNGEALPVIQIVPKSGFYDYDAKYVSGDTEYLVPAPIDRVSYELLQQAAVKAYSVLGCRGAARVDFLMREREFYCLEVNTVPGMTETSLLPKAACVAGIDFDSLVEIMLLDAGLDK